MQSPIDFFQSTVRSIYPQLEHEALDYFSSMLIHRKFKKKEVFIDLGQWHNEIGFLAEGFMRGYYLNEKGDEMTTKIVDRGNFATQYSAFVYQRKSQYCFQCLEDCVLLCIQYDDLQQAYKLYPDLEKLGRLVAESIIDILEKRSESFQFMNAEERYVDFLNRFPGLMNKISVNHLSSYLGVRRPSLSRIRRKIAS
ncbi:MAG: Crp/Fnr family transcriptional regulator [Bacteroidota bacterium]